MDVRNPWRRARRVALVAATGTALLAAAVASGALSSSQHTEQLIYPNVGSSTATCAGKRHVGFGGFFTDTESDQTPYAFVTGAVPSGKDVDRWKVSGYNASAIQAAQLRAYAYCFSGKQPTVKKRAKSIAGGANSAAGVSATCPKSRTLIGGGFHIAAPPAGGGGNLILNSLDRTANKRGIEVQIVNEKGNAVSLTAYAVCGKGKTAVPAAKEIAVDPFKRQSATSRCPGDKKVLFGGFKAQYKDDPGGGSNYRSALPEAMSSPRSDEVKVTALGLSGNAAKPNLTAIAFCR